MPIINGSADVIVLSHPVTGELRVELISALASSNSALELWRGQNTGRYFLYSQDAYYNSRLSERRNAGNMISPIAPAERLTLVSNIWGAPTSSSDYVEITRSKIDLQDVPLDELPN